MRPTKQAVVAVLRDALRAELHAVESVAAMARDEASSAETRSEGKYDTRATEASYLARGQAWRVAELRQLTAWYQLFDPNQPLDTPTAQVGALVEVDGPRRELLFIAPVGGGRIEVDGVSVRVISPSSPMGEGLLELEAGDEFELEGPTGPIQHSLVWLV
jgi:transcription elongation GreA/GreB family factor